MPTTPLGVFYPAGTDGYDLTVDLAAMANSVDGAIGRRNRHVEYTFSRIVENATLTTLNATPTVVTTASSSNHASFFTAATTGFMSENAGIYLITIQANLVAPSSGRAFLSIIANGTEYRTTVAPEDVGSFSVNTYLPPAALVDILIYQTTGSQRTVTGRLNVTYLGSI